MPPTITNESGTEDDSSSFKTYYLKIRADGAVFYKFGSCTGKVAHRFSKEPPEIEIEIQKIWTHKTANSCALHEERLFRDYRGDRPYIGRCGPLRHARGNTEVYSHDVYHGEPSPYSYIVRMHLEGAPILHVQAYARRNPREIYAHLYGQVRYMDYLYGPEDSGEGPFFQVPDKSSATHVVIASRQYLDNLLEKNRPSERWFPKRLALDTFGHCIRVTKWSDYQHMKFWGKGFRVSSWDDWG